MFIFLFRSLKIAITSLIPNILSAASVLGIIGWSGIPIDIMTVTVAAIGIGIGVDNTIHYVHRFLKEYELQKNYESIGYSATEVKLHLNKIFGMA